MPSLGNLTTAWSLVSEMDLQPLREQAAHLPVIAIVGKQGSGRHALAAQMRRDAVRPEIETTSSLHVLDIDEANQLSKVELCVLLMKFSEQDDVEERLLVRSLLDSGVPVLVIFNQAAEPQISDSSMKVIEKSMAMDAWVAWGKQNVLVGSVEDQKFLLSEFVPRVMQLLPERHLALGRHFPLFRVPVARQLINESSFSNAAYSFSTGIVEIIPILNIPLNVADIVILTKNQLFMVFKLGLALGMSTRLQSYLTAFGGVLGAGFFWRQVAHMLVGLIPAWGILPKTSVAYAGTYVVGSAVLQWYVTGKHISKEQINRLYAQAYASGKVLASKMKPRWPRLTSGRKKRAPKRLMGASPTQKCPACGKENPTDANYCLNCGESLSLAAPQVQGG